MHRPKGELLSHVTSQASLDKSLCLANQHQQKMVLHPAAPPATVQCPQNTVKGTEHEPSPPFQYTAH